ncbi:MAG: beta-lactamase hydrolase domain-containing protein [Lysobacteraceae bacterium]
MSRPSLRSAGVLASSLLIAMLAVACASHPPRPAPASLPSTAPSGLPLHRPQPQLYTAGQPAAGDWSTIAAGGVRTVIDLRTPGELKDRDERAEVEAAGLRYVALPIAGHAGVTPENARALSALLADAHGPVLVHCASGNRAGGLLALALAAQGMAPADAIDAGRSAGMTSTETQVRQALELPAADAAP